MQVANAQYDKIVAKDGSGDYTTVQAAINAAPTSLTVPYKIFIKNGKYKEKINIPSNKPFLQFIGESVANVILTFDDYSGKANPAGGTFGTSTSASVTVNATDFTAINITFENTTGESPQALAINVNADRAAFKNCRFLGGQDTVLTNANGGRNYFKNCYIDGTVDFIFGGARAVFDSCVIYAKTRSSAGNSYITAANTTATEPYGYVFRDCKIPANRGTTVYYLGRPWQNDAGTALASKSRTKVQFLNTKMSSSVRADGWSTWDAGTDTALITYAEYKTQKMDGSLLDVSQRVSWSKQLADTSAAKLNNTNLFGTWDPCAVTADFCTYLPEPIAVSNFAGAKGASTAVFNWNISWPMTSIKYELFRSSDRIAFAKINEQTSANDTAVNFTYSEANPPAGQTYYYYVLASKPGYASHVTDTVAISSTPTITTAGVLGSYLQGLGTPSNYQNITVSGVNLTDNVTITAPASYEISSNAGTTWNNSSTPIVLTPTSGTLAATTISIRLNGTAVGAYTGNVVLTSAGAATVNLSVTGTVQADALLVSTILEYWPLTTNNQDSTAIRATGVVATTPTFNKLTVSDGVTVSAVPSYSATHGQAYAPSATGLWSTASGGPGGTLNRTFYQQFTVTASANASLRIDSLILNHSFYNTSSNTRLAVVYSKTGFTTADSTNFAAASFTSPITITNETAGTTVNYRLAFNGATGVTLSAGQTLTFRLYNSCGSGSTGRYGKLKNLYILGNATVTLPVTLQSFTANAEATSVLLDWVTSNEVNAQSFVVEKSTNGNNFTAIGTVGANNKAGINTYHFSDVSALANLTYYRLKMVDKDGAFTYSKVVVINSQLTAKFIAYPNPTSNVITLVHPKVNTTANVKIIGVNGSVVFAKAITVGATQSLLDVSVLSPGNYTIIFDAENTHLKTLFLKQ
jgi:pectinesterase